MARTTVLVATDPNDDLHAAVVADELRKLGVRVVVWDPVNLPATAVSVRLGDSSALRISDSRGDVFSAQDIRSVLYRRPTPIAELEVVDPEYRNIVRQEWLAALKGLWDFLEFQGVTFVSHPSAIQRAEVKVRQLAVARLLGLNVPKTLVTNSKQELENFFHDAGAVVAMKKLKTHSIAMGEHTALFVTRLLRNLDDISPDELALCPLVFQEFIPKMCDVRIIVVGETVFGFRIFSQDDERTKLDYRAGKEATFALRHESYEPPAKVAVACCKMLSIFGLKFGAFDFAISPAGEHVFFELNPNGQWLWLQLATNVPLVAALCNLLAGRLD